MEKSAACVDCSFSAVGNRHLCLQLDMDGVQRQQYALGLVATIAPTDCASCCSNMVHGGGRTAAYLAGTVEMGAPGSFGSFGRIVRGLVCLQLEMDRVSRPRAALGLVEPAAGASHCGGAANMV